MELLSDRFIMSDLFYSMQFLRSRISVFAQVDDFKFFIAINWYQEEHSDIATMVIATMVIATAVILSVNQHLVFNGRACYFIFNSVDELRW